MKMSAAICVLWLGLAAVCTASDASPPAEKIVETSPDGKYAMRIRFDRELNDRMMAHERNPPPANHGLHSEAISEIELVRVSTGQPLVTLMGDDQAGTHFSGVSLLWSSDSRWCAYFYAHPRFSHTTVYRSDGKKFRMLAGTDKLLLKHKIDVRNEYLEPIVWSKPGVLVLRQQTIGREGADGADGLDCKVTQQISVSGAVKLVAKKCYVDIEEAEREIKKLKPAADS